MSRERNEDPLTPMEELSEVFIIEDSLKRHGPGVFGLVGEDGNANSIIARVQRALKKKGWSDRALVKVGEEMRSGDYDNVLQWAIRLQDPRSTELAALACELDERKRQLEQDR